ncbi:DUF6119 family protein [Shewanella fodinae]|uniref:DUF6119 family protein n=1 Tax=Shewanella fodinae TaxID=552357 RepID=UPI00167493A0|nr:DUF6119 family protein [Shewanella fodinae]MCL2908103.1 TIGR04141 family sporadically distributed protein [Shewanella fodinae]GGZ01238.1 hypothetical protein GCM10007169_17530 [Shewanella fodinae]
MDCELGKITLYLSRSSKSFQDVVDHKKIRERDSVNFKVRSFQVEGVDCKFYCEQVINHASDAPPWLDFINENLSDGDLVDFKPKSERPSGLLLINKNNRIYAASFGTRGSSWLNKKAMEPDFGIIVAMNLCGNSDVRQAKSSIHSYTTQVIDRQQSKPSDTFDFGMSDVELLRFISAHLQDDKNVTLQGKDCLTLKVIGEDKLSWKRLISFIDEFYLSYQSDSYKDLFPNYPNLSPVDETVVEELNNQLINDLVTRNLSKIHIAIPEFISDDQYSFTYTNSTKKENKIFSHVRVEDIYTQVFKRPEDITIKSLNNRKIFAYSHDDDRILNHLKWCIYDCLVSEIIFNNEYFILSLGEWRKVDNDFYQSVEKFIANDLLELDIADEFKNFDISCSKDMQNREERFNDIYCQTNENAIEFDQAKLKIGKAKKDKEFCDILEKSGNEVHIIQVKKHSGCSSVSYLFAQTRFYCEFFLTDEVFLQEIRQYIEQQPKSCKQAFLDHIKPNTEEVVGSDYCVKMWLLYDQSKAKPDKNDLPLMAKYELKLTYEKLRKTLKFKQVSLSMVPVKMVNFTRAKASKNAA